MNDLPIVSSSGTPPGIERRPKNSRSHSTGLSIGRVVFALFTISALVILGWFVWSINSVLNARTTVLEESAERISALEAQLSTSTEIFTESGESMNDEISEWKSETRKVWAAYQAHKKWIDENTPVIAQLREDISGLNVQISSIQGSLTDIDNTLTQIASRQRDLTDELNTTLQTANALLEQLESSVEQHDKDIESMDDFRKQVNTRIRDIQQRLGNLESNN